MALSEAKARYCRMLDTKDWTGFAALMTEDFALDVSEGSEIPVITGREAAAKQIQSSILMAKTAHQVPSPEIVLDALLMAVWRRRPTQRVMVHSDQGSQYGSDGWLRFCKTNNLEPSMSRRGNCWDNAVAESFFSSLKKERIKRRIYKTRDMARADVFEYIEMFYNPTGRHSHLGGVSPEAFEQASK